MGCQQNVHDAERLRTLFNKLGFTESKEENAELVVIVACSVRQKAVDRVFGKLRNWQKAHKMVLLTACVLSSDKKKFQEKGVTFFDIEDLNSLKPLLDLKIRDDFNSIASNQSNSGYLPIITGCNNFCSYCAVPYTRGREKSRPVDEIVSDFKKLIASGHKEITLLGQNVNSYRGNIQHMGSLADTRDDNGLTVISKSSPTVISNEGEKSHALFSDLLQVLNELDGDFTIKFLSNHPKDLSDDLIEAIATLPKVAKQIHLPLQSGSNKILKAMNRHYTAEDYLRLVKSLKSKVPNVEISTDIIVGFPGETEANFQDTIDVAKQCKFNIAFIGIYSPRSGTAASKLVDNVPLTEKKRRFRELDGLINRSK